MTKIIAALLATLLSTAAIAQCQPIGWRLVYQKSISLTERLCVYEKNGVKVQIIVDGFCPFDPC